MTLTGRNLDTLARLHDKLVVLHLHGQLAFEHKEELAGTRMRMPGLTGGRRHEFLNDAEAGGFDEMPSIAVRSLRAAPFIVFRRCCTDDFRRHDPISQA